VTSYPISFRVSLPILISSEIAAAVGGELKRGVKVGVT
jgi:hypothetical protein